MSWLKKLRYRYYRLKWDVAGWLANYGIELPSPVHLDVETAASCNLACVMCPYGEGTFTDLGIQDPDMGREALRQGKALGCKSVKLNFRGEPALAKHLERLIRTAKRLGYTEVFMNSNGIPWTPERIAQAKANGLDRIIISVDGATQATYEAIRQGKDKRRWEKLLANIETFRELKHNVTVQMTAQDGNRHEVEQFRHMWPEDVTVSVNEARKIGTERKVCPQPFRRLIVGYDGTAFGCCHNWNNEFPVGKFPEESLQAIWKGQRMQELRRHSMAGTGPCANCDVREAWKS